MPPELSSDETTVVTTYSSRQDAEIAKTQLEERGISALILADDVHPPFQLTEGVELRVLDQDVEHARQLLPLDGPSATEISGTGKLPESEEDSGNLTFSQGGFVQATAWTYVAAFLLMVTVIVMGLLTSSWGF